METLISPSLTIEEKKTMTTLTTSIPARPTSAASHTAGETTIGEPARGLLRLAVLGSPEVVHDGRRLTFSLRMAQALLLYLAVEGGMHLRSKLAALLWPDSEPHDARNALRNALALLRRLLADASPAGHSHLLIEGELLGLNRQAFELDLQVVQHAYKQAQRYATLPAEPQRTALLTQVQHALALVRGSFLDGLVLWEDAPFNEWLSPPQPQRHGTPPVAFLA